VLVNVVSHTIAREWNLASWERASLVSVVSIGVLTGVGLSGVFGDQIGRRLPIICAYGGIVLFSLLTMVAQTFRQIVCLRALIGISCGLGQPSSLSICTEMTPARWRVVVQSAVQGFFVFGEMYSATLLWYDDPDLEHLHWRRLVLLGSLPAMMLFVFALLFLEQSPLWLDGKGDYEGAVQVLRSISYHNDAGSDVDFTPTLRRRSSPRRASPRRATPRRWLLEPLSIVFSAELLYPTFVATYSSFVTTMVYYGGLYVFPRILMLADMGMSAAASLIVGAFWELPGIIIAPVASDLIARKVIILAYLALTSVSAMAFAKGAMSQVEGVGVWSMVLMHVGYMGLKAIPYIGAIPIYVFGTEIYPTTARNAGSAVFMAGGRIGAMSAPLLFEAILLYTGSFAGFFYVVAVACVINAILFLPVEVDFGDDTEDDIIEETQPLAPAAA